jgi:hypothetical protein
MYVQEREVIEGVEVRLWLYAWAFDKIHYTVIPESPLQALK